jgi:hypothetical protein
MTEYTDLLNRLDGIRQQNVDIKIAQAALAAKLEEHCAAEERLLKRRQQIPAILSALAAWAAVLVAFLSRYLH